MEGSKNEDSKVQPVSINEFGRFEGLILAQVFPYLTASDLKNCRLVSNLWNNVIKETPPLAANFCPTFAGAKPFRQRLRAVSNIFTVKPQMFGPRLCFQKIYDSRKVSEEIWSDSHTSQTTELEYKLCVFDEDYFVNLNTRFENISTLILNQVLFTSNDGSDYSSTNSRISPFPKLDKLVIMTNHGWSMRNGLPYFLLSGCKHLTDFTLCFGDSGILNLDRIAFYRMFKSVSIILKNNSKTLRHLSISTYQKNLSNRPGIIGTTQWDVPNNIVNHVVTRLFLAEMKASHWLDYGLDLLTLKIELRLLAADFNDRRMDPYLTRFISSMKALKKLTIGELFMGDYRENEVHLFTTYIPRGCSLHATHLDQIDHWPKGDWGHRTMKRFLTNMIKLKDGKRESTCMTYFRLREESDEFGSGATIANFDSPNVQQHIRYVGPSIGRSQHFLLFDFTQWMHILTKIEVCYSCCGRGSFRVRNPDMQLIATNCTNLEVLRFRRCDMSRISDSGLTGLTLDAVNRMKMARNYEILGGELVGVPLSNLANLRVLEMSRVGVYVTDITVRHAFSGWMGDNGHLEELDFSGGLLTPEGCGLLQTSFNHTKIAWEVSF